MLNLIEKVKSLGSGARTLIDWLGDGGICVDQETAQARTNTCIPCPLNSTDSPITAAIASAIKEQVALKNGLGLRTDGIKSIKRCSACGCHLPLKIWVPIDVILKGENEESLAKYDPNCWILSEKLNQTTNP